MLNAKFKVVKSMLVFRFNTREILIIVNICIHISPRLLPFTLSGWWCSSAFRGLGVRREKTTKIFFSKKFTCHCTTLQFAIDSKQSTKQCTHIHRFTHIKHICIYTHLYIHTFIHSHIKCIYIYTLTLSLVLGGEGPFLVSVD